MLREQLAHRGVELFFTLFRRLIRRVTSIELLVVAALVDIDLFQKIRLLDTEIDEAVKAARRA